MWRAFLDGLGYGLGFTLLLAGLGALRELLAPGLLVAGLAGRRFIPAGRSWSRYASCGFVVSRSA